jgi:glycosyltransferase involved in cell wall biosynthesis
LFKKNNKKIKVLFVLPSLAGGGAQRVVLNLLNYLNPALFDINFLLFVKEGRLISFLPKNIPVMTLHVKKLRYAFPSLIKIIRRSKPDILFSTLGHVNIALILFKFLMPINTALIIREANTPSISLKASKYSLLFRKLYKTLYKYADHVIALSEGIADELIANNNIPPPKVSVIYNPVDVDHIRNSIKDIKRKQYDALHFVCSGRLIKQKGFDRLIKLLPDFPTHAIVSILGEGPDLDFLKNLAKKYNVVDRVKFLGFQQNPWEWYAGADAFLMPSRWEGMPNAALEALACGCPVIGTPESGALHEISKNIKNKSIIIASISNEFLNAVKNTKIRNVQSIEKSLLYYRNEMDFAIEQFSNLFCKIMGNAKHIKPTSVNKNIK